MPNLYLLDACAGVHNVSGEGRFQTSPGNRLRRLTSRTLDGRRNGIVRPDAVGPARDH